MRHRLAQLLAASSREENPRAAACSPPSSSPGEAGREAEPHHEEAAEAFLEEPGHVDGNEELLFPAGLELDDWLEAAVAAEARPDWEASEDGAGGSPSRPAMSWLSQLPASRSSSSSSSRRPSGGNSRMKAAAAARLNRQKKKQYVLGLESRLQGLAAENRQLRDRNRGLGRRLRELERETSYLRAVLANQSALGRILSHLAGGDRAGLRISCSSLFEDQRQPPPSRTPLEGRLSWESSSTSSSSSDHDYALPAPEEEGEEEEEDKRAFPSSSPGGICLHVDWDQVSIEFCSACARRAASSALAAAPPAKIFSFRCLPCQAPLCRG